jgi:hypothetical protein
VHLYWIPLGAGGSGFVRMNGRIYEALVSRLQRRTPLDLYHTALVVHAPEGRFVVETMWPSPDDDLATRGVVVHGPVFARWLARFRTFRYEVRCWREGDLPDAGEAVGGARLLSKDPDVARGLLRHVGSVPAYTWGRDPFGNGDMWNSNSVISWLLIRAGIHAGDLEVPTGGRAPGWEAGIFSATNQEPERGLASG